MSATHAIAAMPQNLVLALLRRVPDYKFDGAQVADWLMAHRDQWLAVCPLVLQNGPLLTSLYGGVFAASGILVMCLTPSVDLIRTTAITEWAALSANAVEGQTAAGWTGFSSFPNLAVVSISWEPLAQS